MLIGDLRLEAIYHELTGRQLNWSSLIADQSLLRNLYLHNLKDGAQLLRTPTSKATKSWLKPLDLKLETVFNLAVSQAKKAIEQTGADALIAGTLSPPPQKLGLDLEQEMSEAIITLDDFGVDCLVIEGYSNIDTTAQLVNMCAKLSNLPLAIFLSINQTTSSQEVEKFNALIAPFAVELLGLHCSENQIDWLSALKAPSKGLMVDHYTTTVALKAKIKTADVGLLLAGPQLTRTSWKHLLADL